jgi:hypothetical protein
MMTIAAMIEAEGVRRHEDHGEHDQPEHQIADHARRVHVGPGPLHGFHHPTAHQHGVQPDLAKRLVDDALQELREQIPREDDDQRAQQRRNEVGNLCEAGLQSLGERWALDEWVLKANHGSPRRAELGAGAALAIEDDASAARGTE